MPELPEVETVKRQLEKNIEKSKVEKIEFLDSRVIKKITAKNFQKKVVGQTVKKVKRQGKVLILELSSGAVLMHLRIAGWIVVSKKEQKYARVKFIFKNGKIMHFCDSRVLGTIKYLDDWKKDSLIQTMGPDALEVTALGFENIFKDKKTKIKPALLDQKNIAGIGNIYAQEALFCAGIHPEREANQILKKEYQKLHKCLIKILKKAIESQGSSVDTFRNIDGDDGGYSSFLKVYRKAGLPCPKCKKLIENKVVGGRGTCFCSVCQK